jgi:hemerythrin
MSLITWTKEQFGTNVSAHDTEHQNIFKLLNTLHDTIPSADRATVGGHLDALISYVAEHFGAEEKNMSKIEYAAMPTHKAEHDKLVQICLDLQKKFKAGQTELTQQTTEFLKDWLVTHIPNIDRAYGPVMNGKGIA